MYIKITILYMQIGTNYKITLMYNINCAPRYFHYNFNTSAIKRSSLSSTIPKKMIPDVIEVHKFNTMTSKLKLKIIVEPLDNIKLFILSSIDLPFCMSRHC